MTCVFSNVSRVKDDLLSGQNPFLWQPRNIDLTAKDLKRALLF